MRVPAPRFVLTAAHCLKGRRKVTVKAGAHHRAGVTKGKSVVQERNSTTLVWHVDFNARSLRNDIGLIVLDTPFEFNGKFL